MKRTSLIVITALLLLSVLFGCSSKATYDSVAPQTTNQATADPPAAEKESVADRDEAGFGAESSGVNVPDPGRKMIWNGTINLESTDYETSYQGLTALISETGGFIQSSAVTGEGRRSSGQQRLRYARLTVRVPTENFELFIKSSGNVATLIESSTSAQDVTDYYFDTEAHLEVLKIKEERLIGMLEATSETEYFKQLEYIIQIENELAQVRYEIESLTGTLRRYDSLISYSTIEVYLQEVEVLTATPASPATVGERISSRFSASLNSLAKGFENFVVWVIGYSPMLILAAVVLLVLVLVLRIISRRNSHKS